MAADSQNAAAERAAGRSGKNKLIGGKLRLHRKFKRTVKPAA